MIFFDLVVTIATGVVWTISLAAVAILMGAVLGFPLCALRLSSLFLVRFLATAVILTLRAVPPIVWIFMVYFGIGSGSIKLSPFNASALALGLITTANMAEVYRGALNAIHPGQWEASKVLNLPPYSRFLDVIGPQLIRVSVPSAATYTIGLLKNSALASIVGVPETTFQAQRMATQTYLYLESFAIAGLFYILLALPVAAFSRYADLHLRARVSR